MNVDELKQLVAFLYPLADGAVRGLPRSRDEISGQEKGNLDKALQIYLEVEGAEARVDDIRLEQTCYACPEQYDAYKGDEVVGYLRLRHGYFYTSCPAWDSEHTEIVYEAYPRGDGIFDPDERDYHLTKAKTAILLWLTRQSRHSSAT